nr:hypothetical protein [Actinomadura madurae]
MSTVPLWIAMGAMARVSALDHTPMMAAERLTLISFCVALVAASGSVWESSICSLSFRPIGASPLISSTAIRSADSMSGPYTAPPPDRGRGRRR